MPEEITDESYEYYAELDGLGRCGVTMACIGIDIMPKEDRGEIGSVKPTGWHSVKYDCVEGKYLYNRCHLIGFQLAGENANKRNLITGTRYLNVEGMLPFENMVADYIKETSNHVAYRVTPIFIGNELVCRGIQIEAYSIEDKGDGICFNVYCYNVQPGVEIDYATGESRLAKESNTQNSQNEGVYIINTNTKKIHLPSCASVSSISIKNKKEYKGTLQELIEEGYTCCGSCLD
jgi:DNA-entry nuclease